MMLGGDLACKIWKKGTNFQNWEEKSEKIAKECNRCRVVITDGGDVFFAEVHEQLKDKAPFAKRYVYYDNPEVFVPGGYSEKMAQVLSSPCDGVIFASLLLVDKPIGDVDLTKKKRVGLGYYPLDDVEKIVKARAGREKNAKLTLLYIGGANQYYYDKVIPHFAELLCMGEFENMTILFQQHPRAKIEGNVDLAFMKKFAPVFIGKKIAIVPSEYSLLEAAVLADFVLYSQTTTAPKFLLAGIPTAQVSPTRYDDVLVREGLVESISTAEELTRAIAKRAACDETLKKKAMANLGIAEDWKSRLISLIKGE